MKISRIVWKKIATLEQVQEAEALAASSGIVLKNNYKVFEGDTWISYKP